MAEDLIDFMQQLEATEPPTFMAPQWRYGPKEDALTFYFRNDESYAHRLNDQVTIFLSFDGDHLVGCQVKGVRRRLQSEGHFPVLLGPQQGNLKLGLFFHMLAYDLPDARLVELGQQAKGVELDANEFMPTS